MPVFGLLIDHRMGTHLLRPSSALSNRQLSDDRFRSMHSPRHGEVQKIRPIATNEPRDPNVVIAAYGTQVTLHRNDPVKPAQPVLTSTKVKTVSKQAQRVRILIPTENETILAEANKFHERDWSKKTCEESTICSNVETGEISPQRSPSECSTEGYIDRASLESRLNRKKVRLQKVFALPNSGAYHSSNKIRPHCRSAWENSDNGFSFNGVATFVDFEKVTEDVVESDFPAPSRYKKSNPTCSCGNLIQPSLGSTASLPNGNNGDRSPKSSIVCGGCSSPLRVTVNKFSTRTLTSPFLPSDFGRRTRSNDAPSLIKDVWCSRHKNEISGKLDFRHETLRRPKSAFASVPVNRPTKVDVTPTMSRENRVNGAAKSRCARRNNRPKSAFPRSKEQSSYCGVSALAPGTCAMLDAKALIRQNHRPTTAIKYLKPDKGSTPSITPCVRKAKVSHAMYVMMHNQNPEQVEDTSTSSPGKLRTSRSVSRNSQSLDLSLSASSLSIMLRPEKAGIAKTEGSGSHCISSEKCAEPSPQIELPEDACENPEKIVTANDVIMSEKGSNASDIPLDVTKHAIRTSRCDTEIIGRNCEPLRLLLEQDQRATSEMSGEQNAPDTNEVFVSHNQSLVVKIPPLSAAFVNTLEENYHKTNTGQFETSRKNSMIRRWLAEVESPGSKNCFESEGENRLG